MKVLKLYRLSEGKWQFMVLFNLEGYSNSRKVCEEMELYWLSAKEDGTLVGDDGDTYLLKEAQINIR